MQSFAFPCAPYALAASTCRFREWQTVLASIVGNFDPEGGPLAKRVTGQRATGQRATFGFGFDQRVTFGGLAKRGTSGIRRAVPMRGQQAKPGLI